MDRQRRRCLDANLARDFPAAVGDELNLAVLDLENDKPEVVAIVKSKDRTKLESLAKKFDQGNEHYTVEDIAGWQVFAQPRVVDPDTHFQLLMRDGVVFFNDPGSERAGVIRLDGGVQATAKYDPGDPGRGVTGKAAAAEKPPAAHAPKPGQNSPPPGKNPPPPGKTPPPPGQR